MEPDAMDEDDRSHDHLVARNLRPNPCIYRLLGEIDRSRPFCVESSQADAQRLQEFCHLAIRQLREFVRNAADVKLYSLGEGPARLERALREALGYMQDKERLTNLENILRRAGLGCTSPDQQKRLDVPAASDIRDMVRDAVRLHIDAVVDAAAVSTAELSCVRM